ncbi:expressed unknown protein [Seminavis robusta]|uniref:Uncharacterized protein n=1 Tax=Seminavis robusta TaxID=568900 RepID=A0A9N8HG15_9STRA|nr:expressed unknown protein [Seminavis robusta]|eukprot:Sro376_g129720.1 n/a (77) ;mRNA; r:32091-32321
MDFLERQSKTQTAVVNQQLLEKHPKEQQGGAGVENGIETTEAREDHPFDGIPFAQNEEMEAEEIDGFLLPFDVEDL